ncbi:putative L-lactate dehydrogenase operon regulatory protein [Methylobrevis pamukkalensis]|uniref:Putative L-lactate dehydrogenase operon regulatory protein n=2 Tax=Methylobrevis pamukkalensis TaxID=1439726 RepID=A0A1E3GXN3_9HYPH|nr:putative L-lactate dehydrogenase operon regulatory protein [Methylobrevis pamukkalensis]
MPAERTETPPTLRVFACEAIRKLISEMDIYGDTGDIRLDERELAAELGVSRTPIREALCVLAREGLVRSIARTGFFVERKSRGEIVEMICALASLEAMAARLAARNALDEDLEALADVFRDLDAEDADDLDAYSDANLRFHQEILRLGGNAVIGNMTRA